MNSVSASTKQSQCRERALNGDRRDACPTLSASIRGQFRVFCVFRGLKIGVYSWF
jgi:hypothetical protein